MIVKLLGGEIKENNERFFDLIALKKRFINTYILNIFILLLRLPLWKEHTRRWVYER
jgi:hypothetical protein